MIAAINIIKDLNIRCEFPLNGEKDNGYGDYIIFESSSDNLVCIGEAKKSEMSKAIAQLSPKLITALEVMIYSNLYFLKNNSD